MIKKNSKIMRYDERSKKKCKFSGRLVLVETVRVFKRVLNNMNLQFRSMFDKMKIARHAHKYDRIKILVISIGRLFSNGSDLIMGGDGVGGTYR